MTDKENNETIELKEILHVAGVPNKNGHVYAKDMMKKAFEEYPRDEIFVQMYPDKLLPHHVPEVNIDKIVGAVKKETLEFNEDGSITGIFKVYDKTPMGGAIADLLKNKMKFQLGTIGVGNIDSENVVTNFKLTSIGIEPAEAENEIQLKDPYPNEPK